MPSAVFINNPYIATLTIFVLACFVGYYVVWKVTPALHTPLMSVTNAISSIIILGALIATGTQLSGSIGWLGGLGIFITAINIFGGFVVTQRMLRMYKK
ncbi:NAD(P) transhydrogenase subunit beta [Legionella birminghamensis]|uniref:proton-translocating NAD(P)(+) transhydrogenase n=1 Tax=Legionella birminghamensis TaxID=28083 RepID=A0A378IAF8_9GAMM|nr:proton-translocating transhydrogenase family protein [Legionella birminghamensis]KTC76148.1 NAD(P) transhydrogenase subunit beta [Legionella birminghamensis]STX32228.1 NAD(P) transhydrogenase subunit alpha [Legionella birminghamensis]